MTDTWELVGSIRKSLTAIKDNYDATLEPVSRGSIKLPTEAAEGQKMRYAPKAMKEAPPPIGLHIIDARRDALKDLQFWARFIMGEVKDVDDKPIRVYVDATDINALTSFVATWADRIATDHPDDADNLASDAKQHAKRLESLAWPDRRDWMALGACPVPTEEGDCGGQVRAYTDKASIVCQLCGTDGTLDWWMAQIAPEGADLATADGVIACVAGRTGEVLTHDRVWKWGQRGFILTHGKDAKGRTLYSKAAVLAYATDKTKENVA